MRTRFLFHLILLKILSSTFAYYIFSRFAQLGDSEQYINASLDLSIDRLIDRTFLTENFFAFLALFSGKGVGIHLVTALLVALTIWYVFKEYVKTLPKVFWLILITPLFAVWTSVVGKEALSFCVFLLIVKWVADVVINRKGNNLLLIFAIALGAVLRPHYLLAYLTMVFLAYIFLYRKNITLIRGRHLSVGLYLTISFTLSMFIIIFAYHYYNLWQPYLDFLMTTSESYFLSYDGNTNRTTIKWLTLEDFLSNMYWGIPTSIIGPTPNEALHKPLLIPFFIEGLFSLLLIPYFFYKLTQIAKFNSQIKFFLYNIFLPALIIALLIHYPFGIFNPGTATRYKQSLAPLFYFLPILIICAARFKKLGM